MRISIVIPTHNRDELLAQTLFYLSKQQTEGSLEIEVIVVDDASTDRTAAVIEKFQPVIAKLEYLYHPREQADLSCVSRIRNIGIQKSSGEIITFLDCGILAPPCFATSIAQRYAAAENQVLIHYTVGLFAHEQKDTNLFAGLSPETVLDIARGLLAYPIWVDPREAYFEWSDGNLDLLPAPWALGWSAALSVPKQLTQRVGGFDETFYGWGAEDSEFCYRLYKAGVSFTAVSDCPVFHLPHPTGNAEAKRTNNLVNARKMHVKNYQFDTELFCLLTSTYINTALGWYDQLLISAIIPKYPPAYLSRINAEFLAHTATSLLIGIDNRRTIQQLQTSHVFIYSKRMAKKLQQDFTDRSILYRFGSHTPYPKYFFDTIVISDFIRALGDNLRCPLLTELCRISKRVVILYTKGYISRIKRLSDWPWVEISELQTTIEQAGFNMILKDMDDKYAVIVIDTV